jgi:hypothetical protein
MPRDDLDPRFRTAPGQAPGDYMRKHPPRPLPEFNIPLRCGHTHVATPALPQRRESLWCPRCRAFREQARTHVPPRRATGTA